MKLKIRPRYNLQATGKRMRSIRIERNFSVEDVREYMEFTSVQAIYKWERGECLPSADNLLALAELYEVNPRELFVKEMELDIFYPIIYCKSNMDNRIWSYYRAYMECLRA